MYITMACKSLGTFVCKLSQFQSLANSLKILGSTKIHFTPSGIVIHSLDTANIAFTNLTYKTKVETPLSIAIDLKNFVEVKSNEVEIYTDGHYLIVHDDGLSYKCAPLADTMLDKKDRDPPPSEWESVSLTIIPEHIKKIITMINAKNKYDFKYTDNTLTILDATDNDHEYTIPNTFEQVGSFTSRIQGNYLIDIFMVPKYFENCTITLGNDTPMLVSYSCEWLNLSYFVAPMIDKDT